MRAGDISFLFRNGLSVFDFRGTPHAHKEQVRVSSSPIATNPALRGICIKKIRIGITQGPPNLKGLREILHTM